jgi:hypothetical protein
MSNKKNEVEIKKRRGRPAGKVKVKGVSGRPRKYDREQVALELVEWCKKEANINLCGFTVDTGIVPSMIFTWCKEDPIFQKAYEEAKTILGAKREKLLNMNKLHYKAYDMNAIVYDSYLKYAKREHAQFEAEIKREAEIKVGVETMEQFQALMRQIRSQQVDRKTISDNDLDEET